jgi:hypothetical protein
MTSLCLARIACQWAAHVAANMAASYNNLVQSDLLVS